MRAISIPRPYPWAFIKSDCRILNWSEEIVHRGDVVFQAAKRFDHDAVPRIQRISQAGGFGICTGEPTAHPHGVLAFVAELVDCFSLADVQRMALGDTARAMMSLYAVGDSTDGLITNLEPKEMINWARQAAWAAGPWCAVFVNVRPLPPFASGGSNGWFDVPDAAIAEALGRPA